MQVAPKRGFVLFLRCLSESVCGDRVALRSRGPAIPMTLRGIVSPVVISHRSDYDFHKRRQANRSHAAVLYGKHRPCLSVLADPARGVWPLTKRTNGGRSTPAQPSH
jgi:hypothetical protein